MRRLCANCNTKLGGSQRKFCSLKCQKDYEYSAYVSAWKDGKHDGSVGVRARGLSGYIKRYIRLKHDNMCARCGWKEINPVTGNVPLEIDHVDGDSENNVESNLILLCPNCHSLTKNFKNLNKGKGRIWRTRKYLRNTELSR